MKIKPIICAKNLIDFLKVLLFLKASSVIQLRFSDFRICTTSLISVDLGLGSGIFNTPRPKQCWVNLINNQKKLYQLFEKPTSLYIVRSS